MLHFGYKWLPKLTQWIPVQPVEPGALSDSADMKGDVKRFIIHQRILQCRNRARRKFILSLDVNRSELEACSNLQMWMSWQRLHCTCEVGLGAAGFVAGAAEGSGGAGVTVLRLWAATSETPHLTVCPVHHLYELSHPGDRGSACKK